MAIPGGRGVAVRIHVCPEKEQTGIELAAPAESVPLGTTRISLYKFMCSEIMHCFVKSACVRSRAVTELDPHFQVF